MSIEEAIKNHADHAKWLEEQGCDVTAREFRQVEAWLQELKERREAEMRMNRVWKPDQGLVEPNPSEKIDGYVISPETIEAMGKLVKTLTETLPEIISGALEEYFRRKEEES